MQQISFTGSRHQTGQSSMCFIINEKQKQALDFSYETLNVLLIYFLLIYINIKLLNITI